MNLKRNINFILASIIQGLKTLKEYKTNFYSMIISDLGLIFTISFFLFLFFEINETVFNLGWTTLDILLYSLIFAFTSKLCRLFSLMKIRFQLLSGEFNTFLFRPLSPFIMVCSKTLSGSRLVSDLIILPFIFFILFLNTYSNYLLAFSVWIFGYFYNLTLLNLLSSLSSFFKGLPNGFEMTIHINSITEKFTPLSFKNNYYLFIFVSLLPMSFVSFFVISILKGNFMFVDFFFLAFIIFILLLILQVFLWKYGLKKYEAFG